MSLVSCSCSVLAGDVGLEGLGGGRGGRGLWEGFGGGTGGPISGCLVGGIRAILGVEVAGGDVGPGLVVRGSTGFRIDLVIW